MDEAERRRREFIRSHHPDRGGDPGFFVAGMRLFDAERKSADHEPLPRVVIVRHRPWLAQVAGIVIKWFRHEDTAPRVR